jgi:PAS domain S-box-containing protein
MSKAVLYIDDEFINLESFKMQFENKFDVFTAESAYEAYSILAQNEIKVVISDQRMPDITGIELLEYVKNTYPQVIRILLTAYIQEEYLFEAINRGGVYRYLTKPWNSIELEATIQAAIDNYNLKAENQNLITQLKDKINQLIISEQNFRNVFNSTSDGILILDENNVILNVNRTFCNLVSSNPDTLIGKSFLNYITDNETLINNSDSTETPVIFKLNNTSRNAVFVKMKRNSIEYESSVAQLIVLNDITFEKEFETKLYKTQLLAEEKERERISRDLHDGIGPLLSTLKIYL